MTSVTHIFNVLQDFRSPFTSEFQNTRADIKRERVSDRSALFYQHHRRVWVISLRDQDRRTHRHRTVDSAGAVCVNFASASNGFHRGQCAPMQCFERDRNQRRIKCREPEQMQGRREWVLSRTIFHAHVDDQSHAESAQVVVIIG